MQAQTLRVLLAEDGITETGITLRALCADQGRGLELVIVSNASKLSDTLVQSQPHIAFLALSLLQPDPPRAVTLLQRSAPHIPYSSRINLTLSVYCRSCSVPGLLPPQRSSLPNPNLKPQLLPSTSPLSSLVSRCLAGPASTPFTASALPAIPLRFYLLPVCSAKRLPHSMLSRGLAITS